ncbi:MAG: 16S rRNA processing protein RimM [Deltaproteobacteria bacterium]|nr:16S rRNA processing protein RimM [Deltaproteobacteria bacterium]
MSSKSSKNNKAAHTARLIPLGRVVATHGVRGELRLLPYAFPCPTLSTGLTVWLQDTAGLSSPYCVTNVRPQAPCLLVKLQGVESLTQAQALRESIVSAEETQLAPLRDGEFYYYQVVGLQVHTQAGEELGTIVQVFFSGGHDVWVVQSGQKEYLIPVTEEIVRSIDIATGQAIIEPLEGLLEANR